MPLSSGQHNPQVTAFRSLLDRFCDLVAREGILVRPYEGSGPRHFAALTQEPQARTLADFERYTQVCEETISHEESLTRGNQLLWRMFRKLGLHPCSNLMDNIETDDVIEIYGASYLQLFRSLSFFAICSYTLDDLLCRPFWELFRRDQVLFGRMVGVTDKVLSGELAGVHPWNVEDHSVDEIDSEAGYHAIVHYKMISPLYDAAGTIKGFVNVFRALSCVRTIPETDPHKYTGAPPLELR